jgi:hypothetical protein
VAVGEICEAVAETGGGTQTQPDQICSMQLIHGLLEACGAVAGGAGEPSSSRKLVRATRGRMPHPGIWTSTLPSPWSATILQPTKPPRITLMPTVKGGGNCSL